MVPSRGVHVNAMTSVDRTEDGTAVGHRHRTDSPVRVLMVDDHRAFAEALCLSLAQEERVADCSVAISVEEACTLLEDHEYDVVLMDILMPGVDGIEGTRRIRQDHPDLRIIVLTGYGDLDLLASVAGAGADAFLLKDAPFAEVLDAVLSEDAIDVGSSELLGRVAEHILRRADERTERPPISLTPRESEVLALLAEGSMLADIAALLGITVETCRGYVKTLLAKLGARSQLQAVIAAGRYGLLRDGHPVDNGGP